MISGKDSSSDRNARVFEPDARWTRQYCGWMARGDCESAFCAAAERDGIQLLRAKVPWLNQRGHLHVPDEARSAVPALQMIFELLGGVESAQAVKRTTALPGDYFHPPSGVFVEVDESQHFTSFRRATLDLYPTGTPLGFDLLEYKSLCQELSPRSDRYRRDKAAVGFGQGGRQRQRAYNDSLRDLVTPLMGHPPVIRVAAPDRDGDAAYAAVRDHLRASTGV